ncbi:mating-type HMG-box protein MAT1-2 [Rhizophagus irregularis DAOM 181602=DAOM 197198]|nr:mating-type HMG-box protein MAT1-2 [Rhizophagus irregularis DAOM 181602=DAOM 197198]
MFNTSSTSSKGPGSRSNDLILNNYDASSFANCDSDLFPQTGPTNNSMAAGAAAIDDHNIKKEDNSFQIYDPSNNGGDNGKKLPGSSKMQPEKRPPRPPNAFILYRRAKQPAILAAHRNLTNAEISRFISSCWKSETDEERLAWERYADQKKLEHMQAYPNYVYRPNKNKGKNEKRRQARKNAVATFNSQDTTTTNNYEGGEAGPIRTKKNKGQNRLNNLVGRIEIPMNNKVNGIQNIQNIPIMTPPLSSPSTPTLMSNNNNNNNNNNSNIIYTTMHSMPFAEPEDIMNNPLTHHDLQLQQMRMQEAFLQIQQNNGLSSLSFSDLSPGSFHEETVDPLIFSFPPGDDFYPSHHSSFDSTTTNNSDINNINIQKINTSSCYPEFRDNAHGLADIFTGIHNFESTFQY